MKKYIKTIAAIAAILIIASPIVFGSPKGKNNASIVRNLELFNSLYKELNTFYVDTIDADKSIKTAIYAMLNDIDPYTQYISEEEQEDFFVISTGEYGGIGSMITQREDGVYISEPYEGSPAAKAGLRAGDKIIKIDSLCTEGWESDKVSAHLKGQANTSISVTVKRRFPVGGGDSIVTYKFVREKIKVNPMPYYGVVKGCIGYINLNTFNEKSASLVKDALIELKQNPAVKGIALDLQGNGGGLLESAVQIVGLFVPKGTEVLITRGRDKQSEKIYKTTQEPIDTEIPLAVFVDGATASSSEIVSGALQDLDRAVIIGARSYGKGLVQTSRQLPFDGLLKVTIAKYYIPSGRLIQAIDYSHRNADGSVDRIPDSLTTVFKTAHGREVRDGGGITPDIKITYPSLSRLVYNIVRDQWAFDFATKFASEHTSIAPAEEFVVTDEIYDDFKKFIDPEKFDYDKVCESRLKDLRKLAEIEGYMTDSVKAQFDVFEKILKHDLNHDLDVHRKEISNIIASEILTRFYYQKGSVIQSLKDDDALNEAEKIFTTPGKYEEMLNIAPKAGAKQATEKKKSKNKK